MTDMTPLRIEHQPLREENERLRRMVREDALRRKNAEIDAERAGPPSIAASVPRLTA